MWWIKNNAVVLVDLVHLGTGISMQAKAHESYSQTLFSIILYRFGGMITLICLVLFQHLFQTYLGTRGLFLNLKTEQNMVEILEMY